MSEVDLSLCFVDTSIWLYAFVEGQDARKSQIAKTILQNSEIAVSSAVINEVCLNLLRGSKTNDRSVRGIIESFYNKFQIVETSREVLLRAADLRPRYKFSYWESLLVASALTTAANILYTENLKDGMLVENRLQIIDPFNV